MRKTYEKLKNNEGITLIALVITIIVMLILVAVTIASAVNGGLFQHAGKAAKETNKEIIEEQKLSSGEVNVENKIYNSIDSYIEEDPQAPSKSIEDIQVTISELPTLVQKGKEITAKITYDDFNLVNIEKCKWVFNTNSELIGTNPSNYTGGTLNKNGQEVSFTPQDLKTYYLHILSVDNIGNSKETISNKINISGRDHVGGTN